MIKVCIKYQSKQNTLGVILAQMLRLFRERTCYQVKTNGSGVTDDLVMYMSGAFL